MSATALQLPRYLFVLNEYSLPWEPAAADRDVLEVEDFYPATGESFAIELYSQLVGTGAYHPVKRGEMR